ncbi:hypothetical protein GCM10020331_069220 [Ectobacillus funiculus]
MGQCNGAPGKKGLLALRSALGLYANVRPVEVDEAVAYLSPLKEESAKDVHFVVVRELTGGIYFFLSRRSAQRIKLRTR